MKKAKRTLPQAESSIYDNTACDVFGSEEGLNRMIARAKHDVAQEHRIVFFDQIIEGEVDGQIKRLYFHMSKSEPCGHPDCHHPLTSPMPLHPYKIEFLPLNPL